MAEDNLATASRLNDEGLATELIANWSKDTVVHKFARWAAHDMFYEETSGPYAPMMAPGDEPGQWRAFRYLSVTTALNHYRIEHQVFEVPPPDGESVQVGAKRWDWRESDKVADECYTYFTEELMLSKSYDRLLDQLADEVFHTVFSNRALLYRLNCIASFIVSDLDAEMCNETPDVAKLFRCSGKLKRSSPPKWAQKAVFHRDNGRCTYCRTDLTGIWDSLGSPNFDHMIPLANGGLNDITNLQLLCGDCNGTKSDKPVDAGDNYRRWFPS